MTDHYRDYVMLTWEKHKARLRGFSTANRGKATVLKIEIEITDAYELASLMRSLQEAQQPPPPPAPKTRAAPRRAADLLALPAPVLRLEDRR